MTLLSSILSTLDRRNIANIADILGESEQAVSRGMHSSIATVLGGMASKCEDPVALRKTLDLVPDASRDVTWSQVASGFSEADSPLLSAGKRVLASLFGTSESAATSAISRDSNLRFSQTSTLLAMAAPMVMSFLGRRVRDEGMTMSGLGSLLQRETATIRSALPVGLSDLLWPSAPLASGASPVIAQAVEKESSAGRWIAALALLALIPGLFWLFSHNRRPTTVQIIPSPRGTANRVATDLGVIVKRKMPENVVLRFDTGSSTLRPESQEQLDRITASLRENPNVQIRVGGYTDNIGSAARNRQLSQNRANTVVAVLTRNGISPGRITAEGHGTQDPIADNSTAEGRSQNRRVAVVVLQP